MLKNVYYKPKLSRENYYEISLDNINIDEFYENRPYLYYFMLIVYLYL